MLDVKPILRVVPAVQAAGLLKKHISHTPKRRRAFRQVLNRGFETITAASLLSVESNFIEGL